MIGKAPPLITNRSSVAGVITGVGFLGAGSITRQEGYVAGLTTVATMWMWRRSASRSGWRVRVAGASTTAAGPFGRYRPGSG